MSKSKALDNFRTVDADWIIQRILFLWHMHMEALKAGKRVQRQVLYVEGEPGGGKTAVIWEACRRIAASMGRTLVDSASPGDDEFGIRVMHMGNLGEEVVAGLPWVNKDESIMYRALDSMWPRGGMGVLYLDEPFKVAYSQRFTSQLASEGRFGDYFNLGNWLLVMSGNAHDNRAGAVRIGTDTQNRIEHVRYRADIGKVLASFEYPAVPEVALYLRWFGADGPTGPGKLHAFSTNGEPFSSPRAWDKWNTNMHFGLKPDADGFPTIQGLVGTNTALDFKTTFDAVKDLPNVDAMLANPEKYREQINAMGKNNPASICALASVITRRYMESRDLAMMERAIKLVGFSSADHTVSLIAVAETVDAQANDGICVNDTPAYVRYMAANADLVAN